MSFSILNLICLKNKLNNIYITYHMTVMSKMLNDDSSIEDEHVLSESEEDDDDGENMDNFDDLNFEYSDEESTDISMMNDDNETLSDDDDEEGDESDDEEFLFDDVKQSIQYVQDRYGFFKTETNQECTVYNLYLSSRYTDDDDSANMSAQNIDFMEKDRLPLNKEGVLTKQVLYEYLKEKRVLNVNNEETETRGNKDVQNGQVFYLQKILTYNFNLSHDKLIDLFDDDVNEENDPTSNMMQSISKIQDIKFEDSLTLFNKYNTLFVLFTPHKPSRQRNRKSSKKRKHKSSRTTAKRHN